MRMDLPAPVLHSLFALNEAGFEAFVVGGCVRDSLMGQEPCDWDITTSATPEQILAVFRNERTIETGIQHGTVTVVMEDMPLEITTYRVDGDYTDGRHPNKVSFTHSLIEDLRRRDFTVNAMAYHPAVGLVDPFHGQRDLKKRVIRCVGRPKRRFTEDALRILRGLRFCSTKGFAIAPTTAGAIHRLGRLLSNISVERIAAELTLLLCGKNVGAVLPAYADVLSCVVPNIDFEISAKLVAAVRDDPISRLGALLFTLTPDDAENACKMLRLSSRITKNVTDLVRYRSIPLDAERTAVLQALKALGPELLAVMIDIRTVADRCDYTEFCAVWNQLKEQNALCYQVKDLAISGSELVAAGIPSGPEIGAVLNRLLEAVMAGTCSNTREELLKLATKKPVR